LISRKNPHFWTDTIYRDCQKNVPIEDRFSATTPYAAILFSEHYYGKRYKKCLLTQYEKKSLYDFLELVDFKYELKLFLEPVVSH